MTCLVELKTKKQVFDFVVEKLLAQGRRSIDKFSRRCAYRGYEGTKCAIGHLIDDIHYSDLIEEKAISSEPGNVVRQLVEISLNRSLEKDEIHMLEMLQKFHDTVLNASSWKELIPLWFNSNGDPL